MIEKEACENCRFWVECDDDMSLSRGICRRYPPHVPYLEGNATFTHVADDLWCGEWKPVEQKDDGSVFRKYNGPIRSLEEKVCDALALLDRGRTDPAEIIEFLRGEVSS